MAEPAEITNEDTDSDSTAPLEPQSQSASDSGSFGGVEVAYTTTAATQIVETDKENRASFFYVSYTRDDVDPATRPITFAFNGGPGSSSVWLHLGLLGPQRIEFDDDGHPLGGPGRLIHNDLSILDVTDLVLVDAIGTGFSSSEDAEKQDRYYEFDKDIQAFTDFIVGYLNENGRWTSPKFLAGESYGSTRGAAIARRLFDPNGVELNGIIFISPALNFQTIVEERGEYLFHTGNELPFLVYVPTYAATAWYHGQLAEDLQARSLRDLLDEVEEWSIAEYWPALARGDRLDAATSQAVSEQLSRYTGLDPDYIQRYRLRVHIQRFCKELLRKQERTVGRIDSRYTGIDRIADGDRLENDPSLDATGGAITSALNHYLREEVGFDSTEFYKAMSLEVHEAWDYSDFKNRYVDTSEQLREVMSRNPRMPVFVANGYFDLATPHFATEYTMSHMGLDDSLRKNVEMAYYEAGHMMYVHQPSMVRLVDDLRRFISDSK